MDVQSFEKKNVDGKESIEIDFNSAFDCEQIKLTVDGQPLSTGHTEYTGYLKTFL